jgi:predicted ferric reductase
MKNSQWYAVAIGAIGAFFLCVYILRICLRWINHFAVYYFLKYMYYRRIYTRLQGATTWFCALLIFFFLAGNAIYLYLSANNREGLLQQTGILTTVNLIPLALGGHMNFIVNMCGLAEEEYNWMHRWIARVVVIEALLHSILAVTSQRPDFTWAAIVVSKKLTLTRNSWLTPRQAASAMGIIVITSISMLRRHFYETWLRIHQFLAAAIVASIWIHVPGGLTAVPTIYLLITSCVWLGVRLLRIVVILIWNVRNGEDRGRAVIWSIPDAVQVHVRVARSWKYRAGQYSYLCIPGVGYGAWMQWHPYFVSWWYKDEKGQDVVVFIISRQRGFSASLADNSSGNLVLGVKESKDGNPRLLLATDPGSRRGTGFRVFVEGPYGQEMILGEYGTVLLFATGIGIAGLFPFIRQFLQDFHNSEVKARRISLFWEVDSERKCVRSILRSC